VSKVRVRFAPSPTGRLHIGTARTALLNWLYAGKTKGVMILRIEDTDLSRSTAEFEESIMSDLAWMGLNWDEGPDIGGSRGPYRQSERLDLYKKKAGELLQSGAAYRCYCTPEELEERRKQSLSKGMMPKYEGTCRALSPEQEAEWIAQGRIATIRFRVPDGVIGIRDLVRGDIEFSSDVIGDFIILRSDGTPSYHLAVVVDDGEMGVTHVIRGEDHITNTAKHVSLFKALGYRIPEFAHNAMILGPDGGKLSKRHGATSIGEYKQKGYLPEAINNYLALLSFSTGGEREVFTLDELADLFEIEKISKSPAIFDIDKLNWLNGQHIRAADVNRITALCIPYLKEAGLVTGDAETGEISHDEYEQIVKVMDAVRGNFTVLADAPHYATIFLGRFEIEDDTMEWLKKSHVPALLEAFRDLIFGSRNELDIDQGKEIMGTVREMMKPLGIKGKDLFMPIRIGLTGAVKGPELPFVLDILSKDEMIARLDTVIRRAKEVEG
jgi:nondiscriminating glutamyl-tRNA synthetase